MERRNQKLKCMELKCTWHGLQERLLIASNPFNKNEEIYGCPKCQSINSLALACDEPGCWQSVTCGTPTEDGYRNTCGKHAPHVEREDDDES